MSWTVVLDALEDTSDGCVLHEENRRRSILPGWRCPAALLCAARLDLPVMRPGYLLDRLTYHVPRNVLHVKGFQKKKGVGPLVSSRERRALLAPLLNRGETGCQPLALFPHSVYIGFRLFVFPKKCSGWLFSMPWETRVSLVSCAEKPVGVPFCRHRSA